MSDRWFPDDMPRPATNAGTEPFFEAARGHRLVIQRCASCRTYRHPPRPICPHCHSFDSSWDEVGGRGRLFTWSIVHQPFHPATATVLPYVVAVVELDGTEGTRFTSNLVDAAPDDLRLGRAVEVVWEDMDAHLTLPRFRPCP
jgi:3-oxo-4,17-pregnadiene-20-carboxyl-CoA hydratase alpha subunit